MLLYSGALGVSPLGRIIFLGNGLVHLLYLDDSGSTGNKSEKYMVLGGVLVFERQTHWISKQMDELAEVLFPGNGPSVEFHASEIFGGRGRWSSFPDRNARINVILKILEILANSHESAQAFACAVHKQSFGNRDAMEVAFEDLCSRLDKRLKRMHSVDNNTQRGIIILDKSSYETSLQKMAMNFKSLGTRWGSINNLAEVPLFVDSKASRIVQLADHVAYAVFRRYEQGDAKYLDKILTKFDRVDGILHGLAHKQNLDADCMCPACMSRGNYDIS